KRESDGFILLVPRNDVHHRLILQDDRIQVEQFSEEPRRLRHRGLQLEKTFARPAQRKKDGGQIKDEDGFTPGNANGLLDLTKRLLEIFRIVETTDQGFPTGDIARPDPHYIREELYGLLEFSQLHFAFA